MEIRRSVHSTDRMNLSTKNRRSLFFCLVVYNYTVKALVLVSVMLALPNGNKLLKIRLVLEVIIEGGAVVISS